MEFLKNMYLQKSIKEYLDELAARQPTPGGGSAAALTGALGVALLEMVCNFTIGNKRYKDIEKVISSHLSALKKIREEFTALIDDDVKAYNGICSAFKTKDKKIIDNALKNGYRISLKICEFSKSGIDIALELADKSNVNLITDVGCGIELLKAGFNSGAFNSEINLKGIKDLSFTEKGKLVLKKMKDDIEALYKKAISKTSERMA